MVRTNGIGTRFARRRLVADRASARTINLDGEARFPLRARLSSAWAFARDGADTNPGCFMRSSSIGTFFFIFMAGALFSTLANASDLLIWSPVKVAPQTYQATVGFRLPMEWETSAGADIGLGSSPAGRIQSGSELATLWGKIADDHSNFVGTSSREVAVRVDTVRSSGALLFSRSRSWIFSEDLDLQTSRSLNINYARTNSQPASVNASQAVTLTYPQMGTSVSASGTMTDLRGAFTGTLALDQPIAPNLNFTASFTDPLSSEQAGDVRLDYRIKW
jgi:hypothetical protein